jgi:hypothetical protein
LTTCQSVPTFYAHHSCLNKATPRWPPKKATSKATTSLEDAAKAALAEKKSKEALAGDVPQDAPKNNDGAVNSKCPRTENPTLKAPFTSGGSEGLPLNPHQVSPPEANDIIEDGEVLGISAEDQLKLLALQII